MRITTAFNRLLDLTGVWVKTVRFEPDRVVVTVALKRRRLHCPKCSYTTLRRESKQHHDSVWRHVDLGARRRLEIRARLRRLRCPEHGALVEGVPFARYGARFTRDFEDLVAWLMTKTDRTATCRLVRIDWETVGRIIKRVGDELLPADRLGDLFEISLDEVAWRKGHRYLTLIGDHREGCVVWGTEGKGQAAAEQFFEALDPPPGEDPPAAVATSSWEPVPAIMVPFGPCPTVAAGEGAHAAWLEPGIELDPQLVARASRLRAVSMDMTGGYAAAVRAHAPQATIVIDNYHVVALATKALDEVRRERWNELRALEPRVALSSFCGPVPHLLRGPNSLESRTSRGMGNGTIRRWTQELEKPSPARPLRLGGARWRISGEPREVAGQPGGWRRGPYYRLRACDNITPPEGRALATSALVRGGGPANAEIG